MTTVFNYGSINIDHVYQVREIVVPGETCAASSYQRVSGGKGANQSVALARAGARVCHIGQIGPDGESERRNLDAAGVDTRFLTTGDISTGCAFIQVAESGENAIVILGGANRANQIDAIETALGSAQPGDIFLTQNETNDIDVTIRAAKARGCRVCVNPAPANAELSALPFEAIDILVLNEKEAELLTGAPSSQEALECLANRYSHLEIVLTLGAQGGLYYSQAEQFSFPAVPVQTVVDTTGAGDCFIGFYLAGVVDGLPAKERLAFAARASALSVSRAGASTSIPTRTEVEQAIISG